LAGQLSAILNFAPELVTTATLIVDTKGQGFSDITGEAKRFVEECKAGEGVFFVYLQHTSASLVIQENADPDVQADLISALDRLAPQDAPWIHDVEGPDDMPAHVKNSLLGCALCASLRGGDAEALRWIDLLESSDELPKLIVNPLRPGRHEPRVIKRRPKPYDLMVRPRHQLRKQLEITARPSLT